MSDEPRNPTSMRDFRGLFTNADPHDIPPGASTEQTNIQCLKPGELTVRKGTRPVIFNNAIAAALTHIISMVHYHHPTGPEWCVYQLSDGTVKAGRGAA